MSDPVPTVIDPNLPGIKLMAAIVAFINHSGVSHSTVLDVLLSMYSEVAVRFPCCHQPAEQALALVITKLQKARTLHHYSEQAAQAAIDSAAHGGMH